MLKGLLCPDCRSELEIRQGSYYCPTCRIPFDTKDGVAVLLPSNLDDAVLDDIAAWDDKKSGRIEHLPPVEALLGLESRIRDFLDHMDWDALVRGRALEVGGGICWASTILKTKSPPIEVFATDIAASSLTRARQLAKAFDVQIDHYMAVDIERSPFPNNYFDIVFGFAVLHHLPNLDKAMKEIHRILRPGGAYYGFGETMMSRLFRLLFTPGGVWKSKGIDTLAKIQERVYTMDEWVRPFKNAGFSKIDISLCKNPRYKYFSRRLLWYYMLIEKLPNFLIPYLLGSEIHIKATK